VISDLPEPVALGLLGKHTDRYQVVIARMADASLKIKALTATAAGLLVSLAVERSQAGLLLVAGVLVLGLAILDAYYLALERGLRASSEALPDLLSQDCAWQKLFRIELPACSPKEVAASLGAPATAVFYLLLIGLLLLGWALA